MNPRISGLAYVIVAAVVTISLFGAFTYMTTNYSPDPSLALANPNCPSAIHYEHFRKSVQQSVDVALSSSQIKLTDRSAPSYSITLNVRSNGMSFCLTEDQLTTFFVFLDGVGQGTGWRNAVAEMEKGKAR